VFSSDYRPLMHHLATVTNVTNQHCYIAFLTVLTEARKNEFYMHFFFLSFCLIDMFSMSAQVTLGPQRQMFGDMGIVGVGFGG